MKKVLVFLVLILTCAEVSYAIEKDGIIYRLDKETKTASVTEITKSGEVIIPTSVWYYNSDSGKDDEYIVTSIARDASAGSSRMTSLFIPNTITSIGENAFQICPSLVSVSFPESITTIPSGVLLGCPKLEKVVIPSSVISIANNALGGGSYSSSIKTIVVSDLNSWYHLMDSRNSALSGEYNLYLGEELVTDIIVPSDVTSIGKNPYSGCVSLLSLTIPEHVTEIKGSAFQGCVNAKSLTIPSSVTTICESAFSNLQLETLELHTMFAETEISTDKWWPQSVDKVIIGDNLTQINKSFYNCSMNSLYIPSSLTELNSLFGYTYDSDIPHLSEVHITDLAAWCNISFVNGLNPLTVANHLYLDEVELNDLVIPSTVSTISDYAFFGGIFNSVFIPNSVTKIGKSAFEASINSIEFHNHEVEKLSNIGIRDLETIIIGNEVEAYNLSGVSNFVHIKCVEFHCKRVEQPIGTFIYVPELRLGEEVEYISAEAFSSNGMSIERKLNTIIVDENNPFIDSRGNCNAVIRKTDNQLVLGCNTTILPNDIQSIGDNSLKNCKQLTNVVIPNSVTRIGVAAFHLDDELTNITLPNNLTSIGERAFGACSKLGEINIPESVTDIGEGAFYACKSLTSVVVPSSVTTISENLFMGASNLASVSLHSSITNIESQAFYGCESLTSIVIGEHVNNLGDWAFYGCDNLTDVIVRQKTPLSITDNVFSNRANATLYVLFGSKALYESADYWKEFKEILEIGDVNNDGKMTAQDGSLVSQHVAGKALLSGSATIVADMNGDGQITAQDASLILQYVAGKEKLVGNEY